MSAPCKNCAKLITKSGIKKIAYTDGKGHVVVVKSKDYHTEHLSYYQQKLNFK